MSQKNISRESVIKQSIDCTCTGIAYIVSQSSNDEFRKSVMMAFEVKDTVELKSKLHSKLTEISKQRHGGMSQWQIADGKIKKSASFEASNIGSCTEKKEDDWSKIGTLLDTDNIRTHCTEKTCEPAGILSQASVCHPSATEIPEKSTERKQHENKDVETRITDDKRDCTNTDVMKTPDLSQIIEGVKKVSPFCQLAVESPSLNYSCQDVLTCLSEKVINPGKAVHDFPHLPVFNETNLHKEVSGKDCHSMVSELKEDVSVNRLGKKCTNTYTGQSDTYKQPIRDISNGKMYLGQKGKSQNETSEITFLHPEVSNGSITSQRDKQNEFQLHKPTRKDSFIVDDSSYNSQHMYSKRLKADRDSIVGVNPASTKTDVAQPGATGDNVHVKDTDEWFDNVLLEIEDWLN